MGSSLPSRARIEIYARLFCDTSINESLASPLRLLCESPFLSGKRRGVEMQKEKMML